MGNETTTTDPIQASDSPAEPSAPAPDPMIQAGHTATAPLSSLPAPDVPRLGAPFGSSGIIPGAEGSGSPSYAFLCIVSIISLFADVSTKLWAERTLDGYPGIIHVWENHIAFILAKNRGGAWGLLQSTSENVRRPFFLLVSAAAIAFIVTLYRRLQPRQRALKWGLPLVLGGALGNVFDRIRYGHVIDFIDVHVVYKGQDHHWPTFNVADIAICVGVALMAIDMFAARRPRLAPIDPIFITPPPEPALPESPEASASPEAPPGEGEPPAPEAGQQAPHESKPAD
ncbi:signal peptidase II [Pendulispora albinea]|uniref:Lipoprotein signal peptidase n=1 Tax=Pendulispora albinea TaxID=2741071 RepID=A0ABZ2LK12_9BACT